MFEVFNSMLDQDPSFSNFSSVASLSPPTLVVYSTVTVYMKMVSGQRQAGYIEEKWLAESSLECSIHSTVYTIQYLYIVCVRYCYSPH